MRSRFAVPASLLAALAAAAIPASAAAAPQRNHRLTINATPNPITTGDAVLIYGQLNQAKPGHKLIILYHRVNPASTFSVVQTTLTDATGFYEFTRAEGVVTTNRSWFVRSPGPGNAHSRTVHERVAGALTLAANSVTGDTNHPLTFTGSILPATVHAGERVFLQQLSGDTGDDWSTIGNGVIEASSTYSITHKFFQPGVRDLRVVFRGDVRNTKASSDPLTVTIQQTQNSTFTINTSDPTIVVGSPVTISGVLYAPGSTTVPMPATSVTLRGHLHGAAYAPITSTITGADGSYSFTQMPSHNEVYQVRTTFTPPKRRLTAQVFEGVKDMVTISASSTSSTVGGTVTFTGTVTPDKAGHVIYLERKGADGDFHVVKTGRVNGSSAYTFKWTFGSPGTKTFRVFIPGGNANVGAASTPVDITVSLPPVTSLPPAS
jgi:hypothetical protein